MLDRLTRDWLPAALIALGLVLGGSSSGGIWANAALQLLALAAIGLLGLRGGLPRALMLMAAAPVILIVLQLVPLPPALWTMLPGRAEIAAQFALARLPLPWLPLALDRDAAMAVLATLFAPLAMLLATQAASPRGRMLALRVVVGIALASIGLGLLQRFGGSDADWHPYDLTSAGKAVGLFANRNHFATLLLAAMPCAALIVPGRAGLGMVLAVLVFGVVLDGSHAGLALLVPVLALTALFVRPLWRPGAIGKLALASGLVLFVAGASWAAWRAQDLPPAGGPEGHRPVMIATTLTAARDYFPAGSGAGSFQRIYVRYEDPARSSGEYRNHAHSDYAEVLLEYGLPGALLIVAALAWWARRTWQASRGGPALAEARAGAVMLGAMLVHSLVDYPLRTAALAMLAALAAVLLERPASGSRTEAEADPESTSKERRIAL